ncbi:hypothetical protein ACG91C_20490, partial [Acinetobacter baumannii]
MGVLNTRLHHLEREHSSLSEAIDRADTERRAQVGHI